MSKVAAILFMKRERSSGEFEAKARLSMTIAKLMKFVPFLKKKIRS